MSYKQFFSELLKDLAFQKKTPEGICIKWRILNCDLIAEAGGIQMIVSSIESLYNSFTEAGSFHPVHKFLQTVCCGLQDAVQRLSADFRWVKKRLFARMCNIRSVREYKEGTVFTQFFDFAVFFYCECPIADGIHVQAVIPQFLLQHWGAAFDSFFDLAIFNTQEKFPERITLFCFGEAAAYLLTNSQESFGASCMLYNDILQRAALLLGDIYYLIPCSVHEVILCSTALSGNGLIKLLRRMNQTLPRHEVLSENILKYDRKSDKITGIFIQ